MADNSRDRLGRPIRGSHSESRAFPQVPQREFVSGEIAWLEAVNYLQQDLPFHLHEVCEQRWRCAPDAQRNVWRGLAQWGAALTHKARGNEVGALRLAERARETLASAADIPDYIDIKLVYTNIDSLLP